MRPREREVQEAIVAALELAGCDPVLHTSAWRQKGSSGVSKGVPDLLVSHPMLGSLWLGLEVKRDGKAPLSREQSLLALKRKIFVVTSPEEALRVLLGHVAPGGKTPMIEEPRLYALVERVERVLESLGARR